jgi:hypothetical protein
LGGTVPTGGAIAPGGRSVGGGCSCGGLTSLAGFEGLCCRAAFAGPPVPRVAPPLTVAPVEPPLPAELPDDCARVTITLVLRKIAPMTTVPDMRRMQFSCLMELTKALAD